MMEVYTDGSARPNPGSGGWGVVHVEGGAIVRTYFGGELATTNNRMELTGLIEGIRLISPGQAGHIWSDSSYAVNAVTGWAKKWAQAGWVTKSGPVKNRDLIEVALELLRQRPDVQISWLRGHDGHQWNEEADRLANLGRQQTLAEGAAEARDAAADSLQDPSAKDDAHKEAPSEEDLGTDDRALQDPVGAAAHDQLLTALRAAAPTLEAVLAEVDGEEAEDLIYRFWHQSLKMFAIQDLTVRIHTLLGSLAPEGSTLDPWYAQIVSDGTGHTFTLADNDRWLEVARPCVEAYFHSVALLRLAARYARWEGPAPTILPSGWATLLHLYQIR